MAHCGEVPAARLRPDQIEELHFRHPLLVGDKDSWPFVSGCFRRLRKKVSSRSPVSKKTPPVSKYIARRRFVANWATQIPSQSLTARSVPRRLWRRGRELKNGPRAGWLCP